MRIKRFLAKDMKDALEQIKAEMGADAVIMSNKKVASGIEVTAAVDAESKPKMTPKPAIKRPVAKSASRDLSDDTVSIKSHTARSTNNVKSGSISEKIMREEPASLKDFLERQQHRLQQVTGQEEPALLQKKQQSRNSTQQNSNFNAEKKSLSANTDSSAINEMRDELTSLRSMLENQLSGLMWQEVERQSPQRAALINKLVRMGLCEDVAERLTCFLPENIPQREAWKQTLELLINQISVTRNDILRTGGVVALVGPTGAGKTTTAAKLAARFSLKHGSDSVVLISTDNYRIAAYEQLATYGKIIGCTVKKAKDAEELTQVLYAMRSKKLVIIDTAGVSAQDLRLTKQLDTLMKSTVARIRSYLVLPANAQLLSLQNNIDHFKKINLTGCIFTKLDESLSLGEAISISIQNTLPISYLTDGQRVPEDIKVADAKQLLSKAIQLMKENQQHIHFWKPSQQRLASAHE